MLAIQRRIYNLEHQHPRSPTASFLTLVVMAVKKKKEIARRDQGQNGYRERGSKTLSLAIRLIPPRLQQELDSSVKNV